MTFGVPYRGSKNKIVPWALHQLPAAEAFVDLFAGGCAVTHGAMLSGKYRRFLANDIGDAPQLFRDAINGKYRNERRWISREKFQELKGSDPYVRYCWSFGNNAVDYLYSQGVEPWRKALHYARVYGDRSLLREFGINSDGSRADIVKHEQAYKEKYIKWWLSHQGYSEAVSMGRLQSLESLERLERLERLESLGSLQVTRKSYDEVELPADACIYCDPPYRGTAATYCEGFDFGKFDDFLRNADQPIHVSEYTMPEDFVPIASCYKVKGADATGLAGYASEKIFLHEKWAKR